MIRDVAQFYWHFLKLYVRRVARRLTAFTDTPEENQL